VLIQSQNQELIKYSRYRNQINVLLWKSQSILSFHIFHPRTFQSTGYTWKIWSSNPLIVQINIVSSRYLSICSVLPKFSIKFGGPFWVHIPALAFMLSSFVLCAISCGFTIHVSLDQNDFQHVVRFWFSVVIWPKRIKLYKLIKVLLQTILRAIDDSANSWIWPHLCPKWQEYVHQVIKYLALDSTLSNYYGFVMHTNVNLVVMHILVSGFDA